MCASIWHTICPSNCKQLKKLFFADSKKTIATNKSNFMNDYIHIHINVNNSHMYTSRHRNSNGKNID